MFVSDVAALYDVSEAIAAQAMDNIATQKVLFLAVSGKIGAGKDSVAPLIMSKKGYGNAVHESFASTLKNEVQHVIDCIRKASSFSEALAFVKLMNPQPQNFEPVVEALYQDVKDEVVLSSYDRTPSTRKALQWWGTEVRRAFDEDYWVKKSMKKSLEQLAEGTSIYVTDSRFVNEVNCVLGVQGYVVRLEVSPEEQARRIYSRDGKPPTAEALFHTSETALDNYDFPIVISTDENSIEEVVAQALQAMDARSPVSMGAH